MSWDQTLMLKIDRIETRQERIEQAICIMLDPTLSETEKRIQIIETIEGLQDE